MIDFALHSHRRRWVALLGAVLALVLLQGGLELWLFGPQKERLDDLQQQTIRQERRLVQAQALPSNESTFLTRLHGFENDLQQMQGTSERIVKLHDVAMQNGLSIKSANYRYITEPNSLEKTVMQADMEGTYVSLRRFIRTALATDPACGLDSLNVSQQAGGSPLLRIQIQLTMYARPKAAVTPSKAY